MYTLDDISVYIFNWKKVTSSSIKLYEIIHKIIKDTTIINCDETTILYDTTIKHIQLDDSAFYGSQYNTAIKDVTPGKILCIIVGDNLITTKFKEIFISAVNAFNEHNIGIYGPFDKRTDCQDKLQRLFMNVFEVSKTDLGYWFINPTIVSKLKDIDYNTISNFGWGIDIITAVEARKQGYHVVIDWDYETDQLDHTTNYDQGIAIQELHELEKVYYSMQ